MPGSRLALTATVTLAVLGLSTGAGGAQPEEPVAATFPTGTFVADFTHAQRYVEFAPDGTCRWTSFDGFWERPCTYATNGDLFTEMTFEWPEGPQVPATYAWHWDGSLLSFELWGDELQRNRYANYALYPLRLVEDGQVVYVAAANTSPGRMVAATPRFLPSADMPADVIADMTGYRGRTAAVPIARGQPITPDMLEPPAE